MTVQNRRLHLIDAEGNPLPEPLIDAMEFCFYLAERKYHMVDSALIANWAEDIAIQIHEHQPPIAYPKTYGFTRLRWKIGHHQALKTNQCEAFGLSLDLDMLMGYKDSFRGDFEYNLLVDRIKRSLDDRETAVLNLLLAGFDSRAIVKELGLNFGWGRRVVASIRHKIRVVCEGGTVKPDARITRPGARRKPLSIIHLGTLVSTSR